MDYVLWLRYLESKMFSVRFTAPTLCLAHMESKLLLQ